MVMGMSSDWRAFTSITGLVEAVDLTTFLPPVPVSVQFFSYTTIGTPQIITTIGGVACTDANAAIGSGFSPGCAVANSRSVDTASLAIATAMHDLIVVEDRVVLTRMSNVNCRLYTTLVSF